MTTIGIVGSGIAGLHLALYLQRQGIEPTIYVDRDRDAQRRGRLPSSVALMGATRARDTELGTNHWDRDELGTHAVELRVAGERPIAFRGALAQPFLFVDMRVYLPTLLGDFEARGGRVVVGPCTADDVAAIAARHDLAVVATGRDGLTSLFPRVPERSPYDQPQRRLLAGLFRGVRLPKPFAMSFNIAPAAGEVFENQFLTADGHVTGVLVEAIPGGPLEPVTRLRYDDDPRAFNAAVLAVLREHAPGTYARVDDPGAFALTGPLDVLAGAVTPVVRRGWAELPGGRFALAVGDTHITHDPLTGQGANAASRAAWLLGQIVAEHVHRGGRFDRGFCAETEQRLWECTRATTEWSNAFLQPPPPHAIDLLVAASEHLAVADAFVSNFNDPNRQWQVLSSPDATRAFVSDLVARGG